MRLTRTVGGALTAIVALTLGTPSPALQTSTITNGGFEVLDDKYFPRDWSPVGEGVQVSTEARSGRYALRIQRKRTTPMPPETGLNRAWEPASGKGGAMLDVKKGVVRVWYRVLQAERSANMAIVAIPMGAPGLENTGEARATRSIPVDAAGDGVWHELKMAFDYSHAPEVLWVHVGARITGGAADMLLDDFELLQGDASILDVGKIHVYPDASAPDRLATLTACVENIGTAPSAPIALTLELPSGIVAEGPAETHALQPGDASTVRWVLRGLLKPGAIRVVASEGDSHETGTVRLAPRVELLSALATPGLALPGQKVIVEATVWNRGNAVAEGCSVRLSPSSGGAPVTKNLPAILPGRRASVRFEVRAPGTVGASASYRCALIGPEGETPDNVQRVRIAATDALTAPGSATVGPLVLRTGTDRTIAEVRSPGTRQAAAVGLMPHLGRVTCRLPSGATQTLTARYSLPRPSGSGPTNLVSTRTDQAGGRWTFRARIEPLDVGNARVTVSVTCSAARQVLAFEGPVVLAGERSRDPRKVEAIFPGLEWLTADEVSSSDLDIAAAHPDRPRYSPHPNKVTIPAMSVQTRDATVSLYWDVRHRWDGTRDRPQPVFASPDRIEGTSAHRMGLVAPSSAHGAPENAVLDGSSYAYRLPANRALTLTGIVSVGRPEGRPTAPGALAGVMGWFRWFKPDSPARAPQGSDEAQIAWSMRAYMETLWDGEGRGWLPFLGGPGIWRKPSYDPAYLYDLVEATRVLPDHPDTPRWRERVSQVWGKVTPTTMDEFGLAEGDALAALRGHASGLMGVLARQAEDGSFGFDADRRDTGVFRGYDYHELGRPGEVELGLIARNAYVILRVARITGDRALYEAGVRSLKRMQAFRVPRAAQVWEVPVHTPDILAAADAVEAYIEAYRIDGDRRWLTEAKRWAEAGMPFVYVWNAPGKLWMRFGSIPVFGATQYLGSWFGNIVQWNGLRYAAALLKLHPLDSGTRWGGLSWRDIALGITRCAMYQQSTNGENITLWPDSYHTITNVRAAWDFAPRLILKNVWALMGRSEEPETVMVTGPGGWQARITSLGTVSEARWEGQTISFSVRHPASMRGSVVVAGVTRPVNVYVGARPAGERDEGFRADEAGWRYDPLLKAVAVRLPSDAPATIRIEGVRPDVVRLIPPQARAIRFEFDADDEGWINEHDVGMLVVRDQALHGTSTGGDPYIVRANCRIEADSVREVVLRIRADGHGSGQFYWTTADEPYFDEGKVLTFSFPPDGAWHEVVLPVGQHPKWKGRTVTGLRIDPVNSAGVSFALDWVRGR